MGNTKERLYVSKEPGKAITLPEGITYIDPHGRERKMLVFPARGGKMLRTDQKVIHDFIEGVKDPKGTFEFKGAKYKKLPCRAFMREVIERIPTTEEIKAREVEKEQAATLEHFQELLSLPGTTFDIDKLNESQLRDLADSIGVKIHTPAGDLLDPKKLAQNVEQKIYGAKLKPKKEVKASFTVAEVEAAKEASKK